MPDDESKLVVVLHEAHHAPVEDNPVPIGEGVHFLRVDNEERIAAHLPPDDIEGQHLVAPLHLKLLRTV